MSLNKAIIMGNLGKDPEVKTLPSGQTVANFSIATKEKYTKKDGEKVDKTEVTLTKGERLELLYYDARIKNAELSMRLHAKEVQEQITSLQARAAKVISSLESEKEVCREDLQQVKQTVEDKYEIKLEDYSFVEETGKLIKLPE